jgi:hypothetical protein
VVSYPGSFADAGLVVSVSCQRVFSSLIKRRGFGGVDYCVWRSLVCSGDTGVMRIAWLFRMTSRQKKILTRAGNALAMPASI